MLLYKYLYFCFSVQDWSIPFNIVSNISSPSKNSLQLIGTIGVPPDFSVLNLTLNSGANSFKILITLLLGIYWLVTIGEIYGFRFANIYLNSSSEYVSIFSKIEFFTISLPFLFIFTIPWKLVNSGNEFSLSKSIKTVLSIYSSYIFVSGVSTSG